MLAMATAPLYISGEEVRSLASMPELVRAMETAFRRLSGTGDGGGSDEVLQLVRSVVPVRQHAGFLGLMPALCLPEGGLGVKIISFFTGNADKGLPTHTGIVLLLDPTTGMLQALVDAESLTELRTAAASACAAKVLVPRPPEVLCVVGTGVQARSHIRAMRSIFSFKEVRVWGRSLEKAQKCAEDVGGGVTSHASLPEAVSGADIVVTVTMSKEPVLKGAWLKEGAVVCGVGACRPDWRELDDELMQGSLVLVDSREAALKEAGDILLSGASVFAEVGEVICGKTKLPPVPQCGKKFLLFKSLGMALEDVLSAKLIYDKYLVNKS